MLKCLLAMLGLIIFGGTQAMAVEEPPYTSIVVDGKFEVRDYPELTVAEVTVPGGQWEASNKGFRMLAGYIFGGNKGQKRIAMTAPVSLEPAGANLAMTGSVSQLPSEAGWVVRFTMPAGYTLDTLPEPDDPTIRLATVPAHRAAVLRFSGWVQQGDYAQKTEELRQLAARHGYPKATGPALLAQYNPPWTLWFMRRNEVILPVNAP